MANSSISTTSRRFEDAPARNVLEYLQIIYIAMNYIFAAYIMGLRSLVFTELCFKVEPSESKTASAKTKFFMK